MVRRDGMGIKPSFTTSTPLVCGGLRLTPLLRSGRKSSGSMGEECRLLTPVPVDSKSSLLPSEERGLFIRYVRESGLRGWMGCERVAYGV